MSNKIAFITYIYAEADLRFFIDVVLEQFSLDPYLPAMIGNPGVVWQIVASVHVPQFNLKAIAQSMGFEFYFETLTATPLITCSLLEHETVIYSAWAQRLSIQGYNIVILKPYWAFSESPLPRLAHAIENDEALAYIPVVYHIIDDANIDAVDSFFASIQDFTMQRLLCFSYNNTLYLRLAADYVITLNPDCNIFYLSNKLVSSTSDCYAMLTSPLAYRDLASSRFCQEAPVVFSQRDSIVTPCPVEFPQEAVSLDDAPALVQMLDNFRHHLAMNFAALQRCFTLWVVLQRPGALLPLPQERCAGFYYLMQLLLQRIYGHAIGNTLPATAVQVSPLFSKTLVFARTPATQVATNLTGEDIFQLDQLMSTLTLRAFEHDFPLPMESRIYQKILKRLTEYLPAIKTNFANEDTLIAIYGAGRQTELLCCIWQRLGGPSLSAVLVSTATHRKTCHDIPIQLVSQCQADDFNLIILSSSIYEHDMAQTCATLFPDTSLLSIWDPDLTRIFTLESNQELCMR